MSLMACNSQDKKIKKTLSKISNLIHVLTISSDMDEYAIIWGKYIYPWLQGHMNDTIRHEGQVIIMYLTKVLEKILGDNRWNV